MWSFCQDTEGSRVLKAGKSTHQLAILGLVEEEDAAIEVSALVKEPLNSRLLLVPHRQPGRG